MHSTRRGGIDGEAFERLLDWLDPDRARAGERYETIRRKLVKFFEWRGASEAAELADRTFDRIGVKLQEGGVRQEEDPSGYFYGVARNILRESWAEQAQRGRAQRELGATAAGESSEEGAGETAQRLGCLEACLSRLSPHSRELILTYYRGSRSEKIENRKALAARLGIPMNALWIRSHRLRLALESCIQNCLLKGKQ